jgi:ribosomal protein L44E
METKNTEKNGLNFFCKKCNFVCSKQSDWDRHILRAKHKKMDFGVLFPSDGNKKKHQELSEEGYKCACGAHYKCRSGLWKHNLKCSQNNTTSTNNVEDCDDTDSDVLYLDSIPLQKHALMEKENLALLLIETVKQNQELQRQSQEFQQKMFEMMQANAGSYNNNVNCNNNNTTNKFNLNFFLNETCKDAMNINEFIDSIKVSFEDVEYSGAHGFAEGLSRIFLRELNKLDVCKRPIHCSDVKREVFHIKDENNSWENERHLIFKIINLITRKNMFILKDWSEANPLCRDTQTAIHDRFVQLQIACIGPYDDEVEQKEYNKIIAKVAKATAIKKR